MLRETFIKRYILERTNKAEKKTGRTELESEELWGELME